jgi:hypothetical protein
MQEHVLKVSFVQIDPKLPKSFVVEFPKSFVVDF